ncbi:MAG: hypothetical protein IT293_17930 [Deltaproteobacteria bacterium]|nr:hypothetical protein [Deltaproteobacteria bacterium]
MFRRTSSLARRAEHVLFVRRAPLELGLVQRHRIPGHVRHEAHHPLALAVDSHTLTRSGGVQTRLAGGFRELRARPTGGTMVAVTTADRRRWDEERRATLADRRRRQKTVPIEERLLETIAWSAILLAEDLRRNGERPERPLPVGLGTRLS